MEPLCTTTSLDAVALELKTDMDVTVVTAGAINTDALVVFSKCFWSVIALLVAAVTIVVVDKVVVGGIFETTAAYDLFVVSLLDNCALSLEDTLVENLPPAVLYDVVDECDVGGALIENLPI